MNIERHFQAEVIEQNNVVLTEDEEIELAVYLDELVEAQVSGEDERYTEEMARNLAGLAFVAGRSYQSEQTTEEAEKTDDTVALKISARTAGRLLEYLLED